MATKIYNDPWSPSNINCNWKPEKLSRYSFSINLINFNAEGIQLGYEQKSSSPIENIETNLTDYISVNSNTYYNYKCEENLNRGIRYISFFDINKNFLGCQTIFADEYLNGDSYTPTGCTYVRITIYKEAWNKCIFRTKNFSFGDTKDNIPLNIIDNKAGIQIYKNLHFEVYVKEEAIIKNFVNCFNLQSFQAFPNNSYSESSGPNSLIFKVNTENYYKEEYPPEEYFPVFQKNHAYSIGDFVTGEITLWGTYLYICTKNHTSSSLSFEDDYLLTGNWVEAPGNDYNPWLYIDKNIKETYYSEEIGFPYVGSLIFKNLWGCDMLNFLNTYTNTSYLTILYENFFAKNLRYDLCDKFFDQGYFSDINLDENPLNVEGFGVRLIRGESFQNDNILGDNSLNNYFSFRENRHEIPVGWVPDEDSVCVSHFENSIEKPFDHWYSFWSARNIPFFKEKIFEDFKIELVLQKKDVLGNILQRIVDLPILVTFTNNLIKCYFQHSALDGTPYYTNEFLNSEAINRFSYTGNDGFKTKTRVWCPDVKKLTVSSTIFDVRRVDEFPKLINANNNASSPLEGQVCILSWGAENLAVGEKITAIHCLEYSDGENYDRFIFIEEITRNS